MPTFLLDKNIVRRAIGGLRRISSPTPEEAIVLEFLFRAQAINAQLFISQETVNLLKRYASRRETQFLLSLTRVLLVAPYFRRWARRVREEGFSREDAKVLGLATFGTIETGELSGVWQNVRNQVFFPSTEKDYLTLSLPTHHRSCAEGLKTWFLGFSSPPFPNLPKSRNS